MEISNFLEKYKKDGLPKEKYKSERAELLAEIYQYYELSWKKNTWSNYIKWLKENKKKDSKELRQQFKKTKNYFKKDSIKTFASFRLGHIPTKDLYYIKSQGKDMITRGDNFNKWLWFSLKTK